MKLTLIISMDNAASDQDAGKEAARILRAAADGVEMGCIMSSLFDANGNAVGKFHIVGRIEGSRTERRGRH